MKTKSKLWPFFSDLIELFFDALKISIYPLLCYFVGLYHGIHSDQTFIEEFSEFMITFLTTLLSLSTCMVIISRYLVK
jgi:hypothetical protein